MIGPCGAVRAYVPRRRQRAAASAPRSMNLRRNALDRVDNVNPGSRAEAVARNGGIR